MSKRAGKSSADRLLPPPGGVTIRMYRQGLGDCFLLAFASAKKTKPTYVLVDCGSHIAQTGGRATIRKIVDDIIRATGGRLDVVVATHEHSDHLSAFKHEAQRFLDREISIGCLWLAWTEQEDDEMAAELRRHRVASKEALEAALQKLKDKLADNRAGVALSQQVDAALSFFQMEEDGVADRTTSMATQLGLRDPNKVTGNELALAVLKNMASSTEYLQPGQGPKPIPRATAGRAYVLGPPRDRTMIRKSDPSRGSRRETYLTTSLGALPFSAAFLPAADGTEDADLRELSFPFDGRYRRPVEQADKCPLFRDRYGIHDENHAQSWRKIEYDWLQAAGELALHLDKHTNNTSLVLAFEFGPPGEGQVLFFPADAQVGSWLSWKDLQWQVGDRTIRIGDLFRRTTLLKAGHHASHNATLKHDEDHAPYGLELMGDGLIAMIPVDEGAAGKLRGWEMPYGHLYDVLKAKTRGNILRADDGFDDALPVPSTSFTPVPGVDGAQWRRSEALKKGRTGPLYYDLAFQVE